MKLGAKRQVLMIRHASCDHLMIPLPTVTSSPTPECLCSDSNPDLPSLPSFALCVV